MLNASQEKFLRALARMNDQWNNDDPNEDLQQSMEGFAEQHGIHIGHRRVTRSTGCYVVSSEDLARVADISLQEIPQ